MKIESNQFNQATSQIASECKEGVDSKDRLSKQSEKSADPYDLDVNITEKENTPKLMEMTLTRTNCQTCGNCGSTKQRTNCRDCG
jgi:hypothetical protein